MQEVSDSRPKGQASSGGPPKVGFLRILKNFGEYNVAVWDARPVVLTAVVLSDIYPKIDESYRVQTSSGAMRKFIVYTHFNVQLSVTGAKFQCICSQHIGLGFDRRSSSSRNEELFDPQI